jgi:hypothetical protein|tara:strand:+ start:89 stop:352 length:264 start_codon:yes stop_codon:yes gene_type:complete
MPDNDNDLSQRLAVVEQTFGLRSNNAVANPNPNDVRATHVDNINWKALYKVLESEVETIILDPNCPQYVKDWGSRVMQRLAEHLPRR